MRVLELFKTFRNSESGNRWLAGVLALVYGLAVPLATVFLIQQANSGKYFLFIESDAISCFCYWGLALFSAAVSLKKVYDFLYVAFDSKLLAFLSCAAFEFAFITSYFIWFLFFFLVIAIANVIQAANGFLMESNIAPKIKTQETKFFQKQPIENKKQ